MHSVHNHIDLAKVAKNVKQRKKLRIIFANKREFDNYICERTGDMSPVLNVFVDTVIMLDLQSPG